MVPSLREETLNNRRTNVSHRIDSYKYNILGEVGTLRMRGGVTKARTTVARKNDASSGTVRIAKDTARMTCGLIAFEARGIAMLKSGTYFEQVPLETVRKIVKQQLAREISRANGIDKETLERGFALAEEPSPAEVSSFLEQES